MSERLVELKLWYVFDTKRIIRVSGTKRRDEKLRYVDKMGGG